MAKMNPKLEFVIGETSKSISFFTGKRNHNRRSVLVIGLLSATFSAIATILISASEIFDTTWLPILAIVISSAATIVGVVETVFAYRKLWSINNVALADLYHLQRKMDYRLTGKASIPRKEIDEFFAEYDRIIAEADAAWVDTYSTK